LGIGLSMVGEVFMSFSMLLRIPRSDGVSTNFASGRLVHRSTDLISPVPEPPVLGFETVRLEDGHLILAA
jgi:hypothetical protein